MAEHQLSRPMFVERHIASSDRYTEAAHRDRKPWVAEGLPDSRAMEWCIATGARHWRQIWGQKEHSAKAWLEPFSGLLLLLLWPDRDGLRLGASV